MWIAHCFRFPLFGDARGQTFVIPLKGSRGRMSSVTSKLALVSLIFCRFPLLSFEHMRGRGPVLLSKGRRGQTSAVTSKVACESARGHNPVPRSKPSWSNIWSQAKGGFGMVSYSLPGDMRAVRRPPSRHRAVTAKRLASLRMWCRCALRTLFYFPLLSPPM